MYQVLLGNLEPPEDVTPSFIDEEMSGVGSVQQQQAGRRRLFMVRILLQRELLGWRLGYLCRHVLKIPLSAPTLHREALVLCLQLHASRS